MTNTQAKAAPRPASSRQTGTGWKAFIMVASLAATIGGWGILAVNQGQAAAQTQTVQTASLPSTTTQQSSNNGRSSLRQVTGPAVQPQIITRTRSSR